MTCKEKLAIHEPYAIGPDNVGGCAACPSDYGYLERPNWCPYNTGDDLSDAICAKCWDREIPGTVGPKSKPDIAKTLINLKNDLMFGGFSSRDAFDLIEDLLSYDDVRPLILGLEVKSDD